MARRSERSARRFLPGWPIEAVSALFWAGLIAAYLTGSLMPFEDGLRDLRFRANRGATHDVVFVDIDANTLSRVGVWPWPRSLYASIIDRLIEDGASDVLLDVDFSTASTEAEDVAFEAALERAGGFVMLAAFKNGSGNDGYNMPLQRFLTQAIPVTVNVGVDARGVVRTYPSGLTLGNQSVPSAASALAGEEWWLDRFFLIDFSIRPDDILTISAGDVLAGTFAAGTFEGLQVVVGASALELRDLFTTPVAPIVPGAVVQILAAETLKQDRALRPAGSLPTTLAVLLIASLAFALRSRLRPPFALFATASSAALIELIALLLQSQWALLIDTAALHAALVLFLLRAVGLEIAVERFLRLAVSRERDAMRSILDRVIADNFDGVIVIDEDGLILVSSKLAATVLGRKVTTGEDARRVLPYVLSEAVGDQFAGTIPQPEPLLLQLDVGGVERSIEYTVRRSDVPGRTAETARRVVCVTFRDVTERDAAARRIRYLADHDPMSGALSRHRLIEWVDTELGAPQAEISVILVGLGRFKTVNATLGHQHGDQVLKQVAERLSAMRFTVARIGGTTFALAKTGTLSPGALSEICRDIAMALSEPYQLPGGHRAIVTASVGGTTSELSLGGAEVMLRHADMALAAAKAIAGSEAVIYTPSMEERTLEAQALQLALRDALAEGQFSLVYQPQVALASRELIGAEVLMRWRHPTLGDISPARFIPVAEETGLILELGRWILGAACREAASWPGQAHLSVNVSPLQFELSDVLSQVVEALAESKLPPERLEIEITEGVFVGASVEVNETLIALRKLGVRVSLDDFGTGYSSLSYLSRLPIDKIKVDQSFVRQLPRDQTALAVVGTIVQLGVALGKEVVAEGIETDGQADLLQAMGCATGQGYLFGRPVSALDMGRLLNNGVTSRRA